MLVFNHSGDPRVRREAEALVDSGFSVDIIYLGRREEKKVDEYNGVHIFRIFLDQRRSNIFRYLWEYTIFMTVGFVRLSLMHLKKQYKVIHIHNIPDILILCAALPKITRAKVVLDMHEIMPEFFMQKYRLRRENIFIRILESLEKLSVRLADDVIVATPFIKKTVMQRSIHKQECTVILNLPDSKYFFWLDRSYEDSEPFKIIYPGTLSEHHGIDLVIEAIENIKSSNNISVELHIYGEGSEKQYLENLVCNYQLKNEIFFHSGVVWEDLTSIMLNMDAGIVPKRDGIFVGEAISTKLFDFVAVGLPVIASRTPGDTLYFDDSMVTFFEPGNVEDLAACIIQLSQNPELRRVQAENARKVFEKISWERSKQTLVDIYNRLIN